MIRFALLIICSLVFTACDDSGTGGSSPEGTADRVPFDGSIAPTPDAVIIDDRSFFPLFSDAQWRYRKKTNEWQEPPAVMEGAESRVTAGEEPGEYIRRTTVFVDLMVDDEPQLVKQIIEEGYVVEPSVMRVGPVVKVRSVSIEERIAQTDEFIRKTERTYFPPYTLLSDSWRTGQFATRIEESINLTEVITEAGSDEPRETRGNVSLEVITDPEPQVLPMEGRYREAVHKVEVADHFSRTVTRRYWFQQGVGPVQWQYQFSGNTTYTLMESNVESTESTD